MTKTDSVEKIEEKSFKEQAEGLLKIPGDIKGEGFNSFKSHIIEREGEGGLEKVLEEIRNLGVSFDYKKLKPLEFYPENLRVLLVITARKIFGWKEEDIIKMGNYAPRRSLIVKLLLRYLVSIEKLYEKAPLYWHKHYNFGELQTVEFNKERKYVIVRVVGYKFHPVMCLVFTGFFKGITEFCITNRKVESKEIECAHEGHPYHEFMIRWE